MLLDETYEFIKTKGYSPIRDIKEKKYKILLEPYSTDHYFFPEEIDYEFRLKYKYSLISAKPTPAYSINWNIIYDAILCFSKREAEILCAYTKTFIVAPMKYRDFKKIDYRPSDKPVLLYLPTFGDTSSIDNIEKVFKSLKNDYYIITKAHHGTQYHHQEMNRIDILQRSSDEYYTQSTNVTELLERVDVVLSDNSGAIFDAIYAEIPVAIFNNDTLNEQRLGRINTFQHQLVQRSVVPYTNKPNEVGMILNQAKRKQREQICEKADFLIEKDVTKEFVKVIEYFLSENRNCNEYYALHDVIKETFVTQKKEIENYKSEVNKILDSKVWKIANKVASPYRLIVRCLKIIFRKGDRDRTIKSV